MFLISLFPFLVSYKYLLLSMLVVTQVCVTQTCVTQTCVTFNTFTNKYLQNTRKGKSDIKNTLISLLFYALFT